MFHFDIDFQDKNGERHMLPIRIQTLLRQLWSRAFVYREPLDGIERHDGKSTPQALCGSEQPWRTYDPKTEYWGGRDTYIWFRHSFTVPQALAGKTLWYSVEAGDSDYWQWANPQMCLFLNGQCIAGMDSNHRDVEFTQNAEGGKTYQVLISGYTDTVYYERPVCFRPYLAAIDPEVLSLYYDVKVAYDTAHELQPDDLARVDLIAHVNHALNLLALGEDDESFRASVPAAAKYLQEKVYTGHRGGEKPVIAAVGSTHIDVAWLWRYEQTREKAYRSFATALRLLEKNPEYIFMCSQPQLYDFVREDAPELYAQVKHWVKLGRWEVEGAMWVEADTNIPSGESLVRQFLYGKRFIRNEFDTESEVMWLPDVFGYSAALPQIMQKSGVPYFMTTKISWNEYDKLPYDTFRWRGIDGSTVLSHFIPTKEHVQEEKDWMTTYNGQLDPSSVIGAWQRYQQKDLNREVLASFGHGDGGGGTSQQMVENAKRMAKGLPGCPDLMFSGVREFYHRLEKDLQGKKRVPEWDGELYFEYHRGTYTSVAGIKRRNRKNELRLHDAESLSVLRGVLAKTLSQTYPQKELQESWKLLLLNQFHDVIPGSSIGPVYADAYAHHAKIEAAATLAAEQAMAAVCKGLNGVAVFNTLGFARDGTVEVAYDKPFCLSDGEKTYPAVPICAGKWLCYVENIPAKGYKTFAICPAEAERLTLPTGQPTQLENEHYRIAFDEHMNISSFYCKKEQRELLPEGTLAGRLIAFDDNPRVDDAWNIMAYYEEKFRYLDDVQFAAVTQDNALRTVVTVVRRFRSSTVTLRYILWKVQEGLTVECDIDWKEKDLLVKMDFPAKVNTNKASFDIQFGSVERPIHKNTLWDYARFEVCAHKWVDLSDNGFGLSLLNDCKYGYDVSREHIRLSVLRCATYPDPQQDKCEHHFSCMLLPHDGALQLPEVNRAAYSFNTPLYAMRSQQSGSALPSAYSLLTCARDNVLVETVKKAEDSDKLVVRAFECANCGCTATLKAGFPVKAAWLTNLLEEEPQPLQVEDGCIKVPFRPFEIQTIMIACEV